MHFDEHDDKPVDPVPDQIEEEWSCDPGRRIIWWWKPTSAGAPALSSLKGFSGGSSSPCFKSVALLWWQLLLRIRGSADQLEVEEHTYKRYSQSFSWTSSFHHSYQNFIIIVIIIIVIIISASPSERTIRYEVPTKMPDRLWSELPKPGLWVKLSIMRESIEMVFEWLWCW